MALMSLHSPALEACAQTTEQQSRRHRGTLPYVRSQEVILSFPHREGDLSEAASGGCYSSYCCWRSTGGHRAPCVLRRRTNNSRECRTEPRGIVVHPNNLLNPGRGIHVPPG